MRLLLSVFLIVSLIVASPAGAQSAAGNARSAIIEVHPFPPGGDFTLQSAQGKVRLAAMRGKVVLLFFGYTTCPDICPTTLANLQQVFSRLTPLERNEVRVVFVSVDPERDSPALLQSYVASFDLPAIGVTGSGKQLDELADRYGAQFYRTELPGSAMGYAIEHSAAVALIDRRGKLQRLVRHSADPEIIANEVRRLLKPMP